MCILSIRNGLNIIKRLYICLYTLSIEKRLVTRLSRNPTAGASIGEPRALTYTLRTAYVSYA